jgi:hypothetical protein
MSTPVVGDVAPWVERLARTGFTAKALLYITIGILAAEAAFGTGGKTLDTQGALEQVHRMTFGRLMLLAAAIGLLGYAVWRVVEAVVDPDRRGKGLKGLALRASFAARGLFHGALGIAALRLLSGDRSSQGQDRAEDWTAFALSMPAGELVVWLGALSLAGYGFYQFYRAYASKLSRQLRLGEFGPDSSRWVVGVSRFGIAARGVVFCFIGLFLGRAAAQHDASQVGGLRESLAMLERIGQWPFAVVAVGLIAYGVYELVNARYRRIRVT